MYRVYEYSRHTVEEHDIGFPMIRSHGHRLREHPTPEAVLEAYTAYYHCRKRWKRFDYRLSAHLLVELGHSVNIPLPVVVWSVNIGYAYEPHSVMEYIGEIKGRKPIGIYSEYRNWWEDRKHWKKISMAYARAITISMGGTIRET